MKTVTERRITYTYGPSETHDDFTGVFSGDYSWAQLEELVRDSRWGSAYVVTSRKERTVTYGDWEEV